MIPPKQCPPVSRAITHGIWVDGRWLSFFSMTVEQRKSLINRVRFGGQNPTNKLGFC
jgi:hypothetical protein